MDLKKILKKLGNETAVSGSEDKLSEYIKELFSDFCDHVETDKFYNTIGVKKGSRPDGKKILLSAHIDEIGFIVKNIDEKGFVNLSPIGGIDNRILLAQEVIIHGSQEVFGVIGAKPPHLLSDEEKKKTMKMDEMSVDTGLPADKLKELVRIGDIVTIKAEPLFLQGDKISSKALDDRAGVVVLLQALKELQSLKHEAELYVSATVQEEVGLRGATILAGHVDCDLAVVVDVCHGDMPDVNKLDTYGLGKGPVIAIGPNLHRKLSKKLMDLAKEENIPFQIDPEPGNTGTEAWAIQVSKSGIPTVLLSIPLRYMHTPIETASISDIKNTARLIARFIAECKQAEEGNA